MKKTSFDAAPGIVLLATGGLWGVIPEGEAVMNILKRAGVQHGSKGQRHALMALSGLAQKIWSKEEGEHHVCDDITCLLLHWVRPARRQSSPQSSPQQQSQQSSPQRSQQRQSQQFIDSPPPQVSTGSRTKPTTTHPAPSKNEVEAIFSQAHLVQPDPALSHPDIVAQVVSCIETHEPFDLEKPVWFSEKGEPTVMRLEDVNKQWLSKFQASHIQVSTICRKGRRHAHEPSQDTYSITSATGNRAVYVVCDGHGPVGHIASFRVAQSLPMFVLRGLSTKSASEPPENVVAKAVVEANKDLANFGKQNGLNFSDSGATCSVTLRLENRAFVGWLGDCRAMVATVMPQYKKVDIMSDPHLASCAKEYQRLCQAKLSVRSQENDVARIYVPGDDRPGLSVSRTLGDFMLSEGEHSGGVTCEANMTKTTFGGGNPPGLILLTSGGMSEYFDKSNVGDSMLKSLVDEGNLLQNGPELALKSACNAAQQRWKRSCNEYCEDISGILIHWTGGGIHGQAAGVASAGPTVIQGQTLVQGQTGDDRASSGPIVIQGEPVPYQGPLRAGTFAPAQAGLQSGLQASAIPSPQVVKSWLNPGQTTSTLAQSASGSDATVRAAAQIPALSGQELPSGRVSQATHTLPDRTLPSSSPAELESAGEPRKFLQAQPRSLGQTAAASGQKVRVVLQAPPEPEMQGGMRAPPALRMSVATEGAISMPPHASSMHATGGSNPSSPTG